MYCRWFAPVAVSLIIGTLLVPVIARQKQRRQNSRSLKIPDDE